MKERYTHHDIQEGAALVQGDYQHVITSKQVTAAAGRLSMSPGEYFEAVSEAEQ